jgi:pimeloyl-ACP methyl ester carboxylesterase
VRHIQVNGVSLEYMDEGHGVPVVFSHGGFSDLRYWEPQREAFASRYRFIAYSHRFHGRDEWPVQGDYSAEAHVADLLAMIRQLESGPVHLVGFSTAIALRAALQDPGLLRSLTIIEPNVPWLLDGDPHGEAVLDVWREARARINAEAAEDREYAARLWFELVNNRGANTFAAQPEELRQMWSDNFNKQHPQAPPPEPLTCMDLSQIRTPTLALEGEYGMPYSKSIIEKLAACIPKCRLVTMPAVTHFMSYQEPGRFNRVVLDFMAENA